MIATNAVPFPDVLCPPEGYHLVEEGLHKAGNNFISANNLFLQRLELRTVVNMGPGLLNARSSLASWLSKEDIRVENPVGELLGDFDIEEEAMKVALEILLDRNAYPILLVCGVNNNIGARLVGCLRRLQHWSMTSIFDEYRSTTPASFSYDVNERFIEKFDLDLVMFPPREQLPDWLSNHLNMLEIEQMAERNENSLEKCPQYRLDSFVYQTPLISPGIVYSSKRCLLDIDDDD